MSGRKHAFTQLEKKIFMDILKRYGRVVENKDTDGASLRAKNEAWDIITREFNASPHSTSEATNKQLRRLWLNLKQRQREALTRERQHRIATGGGSSTSDAVIDPDIAEVAPALIVGIEEAIDSDTFPESCSIPANRQVPVQEESQSILPPFIAPTTSHSQPSVITDFLFLSHDSSPTTVHSNPITSTHTSFLRPSTPILIPPSPPINSRPRSSPNRRPTSAVQFQRYKNNILDNEYRQRQRRADQLHELEMRVMRERLREAEAKAREAEANAELAEMVLAEKRSTHIRVIED